MNSNFSDVDKNYMKEALIVAKEGIQCGEVPVGCVFVHNDKIIARGHNMTNAKKCSLRHAEFECFDKIGAQFGSLDVIKDCVLYVTCEPCCFCACALLYLGIKKVYCGCKNIRFGGCGSVLEINEIEHSIYRPYECIFGLYEKEAIYLLQQFYLQVNESAPNPKTRKRKRNDISEEELTLTFLINPLKKRKI